MATLETQIGAERLAEDVYAVTPAGELDLHDAAAFERALADVAAAGARRLLVDLGAVTFLDSTVLGVLLRAHERFETLVLAVGDRRVLRVLEITGLDRKLRVERSRPEALALLVERRSA